MESSDKTITAEPIISKSVSPFRRTLRRVFSNPMGVIALVFIVFLLLCVCIPQLIAPGYDISTPDYMHPLEKPSSEHWFGTDEYGRDIYTRIIYGTKYTMQIALISVFSGAFFGVVLGVTAGYYGGIYETIIMRICDILLAFPGMLLAIGIIAIIGTGTWNVVIAVAIYTIPIFTRIIRGNTIELKNMVHIEAARSCGLKDFWIITRHILPGTFSVAIVYITMRIGSAILTGAALSFVGFGAQPPTPEWGSMLSVGRNYVVTAPHIALFPGIAIFVTCLAFNLLGDCLRDALDTKIAD